MKKSNFYSSKPIFYLKKGHFLLIFAFLFLTNNMQAQNFDIGDNKYTINGIVYAITKDNSGNTYVGGGFTSIGQWLGNGVQLDKTTGVQNANIPKVAGQISTVVAIPSGGWYIGGSFTTINGITRNRLARINADGTLHSFNPNMDNQVNSLVLDGSGNLYAGGQFTTVSGTITRNRLCQFDASGSLTAFNPNIGGSIINALVLDGSGNLYAGGNFSNVGGTSRSHLCQFDASGSLTTFNPIMNSIVNTLAINGSNLYAGGLFTMVGNTTRNRLCKFDTSSGALTAFDPNMNNNVNALVFDGSNNLYVGGSFATVGGVSRSRLCKFDATDALAAFNPSMNSTVNALAIDGSNLYVGGNFILIGGSTTRNRLCQFDISSGTLTAFDPNMNNFVRALAIFGSNLFVGGDFTTIGTTTTRNRLCQFDASGNLTAFDPNMNSNVYALVHDGSNLYAGGHFTTVNGGVGRNRLCKLNASGTLTTFSADINGTVHALTHDGSNLYAGGEFTTVGGVGRNRLCKFDANGALTTFNPNMNNFVFALTHDGNNLYAGGQFSTVGGVGRNYLCKFDATGALTTFDPNMNSGVRALVHDGSNLYAGGEFSTVGGNMTRNYLCKFDATGTLTTFNPNMNNFVRALNVNNGNLYAGGHFTSVGGVSRNYLCKFDATGALTTFSQNLNAEVYALALNSSNFLYVGGNFLTPSSNLSIYSNSCSVPSITNAASSNSPICSGSILNLSVSSSGTTPLTYAWSGIGTITNGNTAMPSITGAATGNYTVTVSNDCGSTTSSVAVVINSIPMANAGADATVTCASPSTTLTATGGASYVWNNSATQGGSVTPTATTTYTVTVTAANGCTATDDVVVTADKTAPSANAGNDVTVNCTSPSTTLTATGNGTYVWNNGASQGGSVTPTVTTTYTVTVTATNGCTATDAILVTVDKTAPSANAGNDVTINCTTPSTTLTATGGTTYTWNNGATQGGSVAPTVTTTYTVTVTGANGCTATDDVVVTVDKTAPALFNVSGGGSYCSGGSGLAVGLANSETDVTYQLKKDNVVDGAAVSGTGAAISFGNKTATGVYTVVATNTNSGCTAIMTDSATVMVNALPTAFAVTGGGSYCTGGSGVAIGLSNSESGVTYQLKNGTTNVGTPINGTGSAISFGNQTTAASYTVVATRTSGGCTAAMTDSATVTVNALPTAYSVTGGTYCAGGTGVAVGLSNSETGISYQLKDGTTDVGAPLAGTGSALSFGNQAVATYTVVATNTTSGCTSNMTGSAVVTASCAFITKWKTDNAGTSSSTQITIPGTGTNYSIAWEEVGNAANNGTAVGNGSTTITFPSAGTYRVSISGNFTSIAFNKGGDKSKLLDVEQWGDIAWSSMANAFQGCVNLNITATDVPNLAAVTSMTYMFGDCIALNGPSNIGTWDVSNVTNMFATFFATTAFNQSVNNWNVSNVTDMSSMFSWCATYNQPLDSWDVSKVTSMANMFAKSPLFNQPLSTWNVGAVTNMGGMFDNATAFNQSIGNWDVSKVTNMFRMFRNAVAFNQSIGNWDVSKVTNMAGMFAGADVFNQSINTWNVGAVSNMLGMFDQAAGFNQSIGSWNLSAVTNMTNMLNSCGMNCKSYSLTLAGWAANANTPSNQTLDASGIQYGTDAVSARTTLITTKGWTISGDVASGVACMCQTPVAYTVTGTGSYCSGGAGVAIGLSNSESGVTYQLKNGTTNVGTPINGTGSAISFGNQTTAASYTVVATRTSGGCTATMTDSVTVTVNALPTASISPSGTVSFCSNGTQTLNASTGTGYAYVWKKDGITISGETNSTLTATASGSYIVEITASGCIGTSSATVLKDNEAPTITCADNVTLNTTSGDCYATTTLINPTVSDNCPSLVLSGNALDFDGSDDYVDCSNSAAFQINNGTIEAWIKTPNAGSEHRAIVVKSSAYGLFLYNNQLIAFSWGAPAGNLNTGVTLNDNNWHHIAMTFQSGVANGTKIYKDGILVFTGTMSVSNQNSSLAIGNNTADPQFFSGSIDEVRVWNVIRSQAQIQGSMNLELAAQSGLVAVYHFNQGSAGGDNTGLTTLIDDSGNNFNGTLNNFTLSGTRSNWVSGQTLASLVTINNAPTIYPKGNTTVTWQVTDASGNTNTCQQTVTVKDNEAPTITCSDNVTINTTSGDCYATTTLINPTVSDNCTSLVLSGNALDFDGSNDYVDCSNSAAFQINNGTIEAWIKTPNAGSEHRAIVVKSSAYGLFLYNNQLIAFSWGAPVGNLNTGVTLNDNNWHHIAMTFQSGVANGTKIYKDGILVFTGTMSVSNQNSSLGIGNNISETQFFSGSIDEVRVWNVIRSQAQIQGSMNAELSSGTGLVAAYHFNQGTANDTNTGVTSATDATGHHLNGELKNMALSGSTSNWVSGQTLNVSDVSISNDAPAAYSKGNTTVTWTATDAAGNTNTCQQTVTVNDNEKPTITCSDNVTINTTSGYCTGTATLTNPTVSDNCAGIGSPSNDAPATYPKGLTTVTWQVTDAVGNTKTCQQTVTVKDNEAPTITCSDNVTINAASGDCYTTTTLSNPTISDNCISLASSNALDFDGSDDYVDCSNSAAFQINNGTIEAWVKTQDTGSEYRAIVVKSFAYGLFLYHNQLIAHSWGTGGLFTGVTINDNNWHHVAMTFQSGVANGTKIYKDGILVFTGTMSVSDQNSSLQIGNYATTTQSYSGSIDEVRVWNVVRSQAEIQEGMNAELSSGTGLVAAYHFNQGTANDTNTGVTSATDASGNNLNGTLNNFALSGSTSNWVGGAPLASLVTINNAPTIYPKGNTTVTWQVTDASGNTNTCQQTITVKDNEAPTITCSDNVTINAASGDCYATTTLINPTVSDNCTSLVLSGNALNFDGSDDYVDCSNNAAFQINNGTIEAWIKTQDTGSEYRAIVVKSFAYGLFLYHNQLIAHSWGTGGLFTGVTINDNNWHHVAMTFQSGVANGTKIYKDGILVFTGTMSVSDQNSSLQIGNYATTTQSYSGLIDEVRVWNVVRSQAQIQGSMNAELSSGTGLVAAYHFNQGTANDTNTGVTSATDATGHHLNGELKNMALSGSTSNWVSGQTLNVSDVSISNDAPAMYPKGNTTVTWTATDAAGNTNTCQQMVTVIDNQLPTLTNPDNQTMNVIAGTCAANYTISSPIEDNCTGATWGYILSGATTGSASNIADGTGSGVLSFNKGITDVTITGVDASGNNAASITFTVMVTDNEVPTITCSDNVTINTTSGYCTGTATLTNPTVSDNCAGIGTPSNDAPATYPKGLTTVTWQVTDAVGNTNTCQQTVTVKDNEAPMITCSDNVTINAASGDCYATTTLTNPTISDNCAGIGTPSNNAPATYPQGLTTVTWQVTDAVGNTNTCQQTVTVKDNEAPTITCSDNVTINTTSGLCTGTTTLVSPVVNDNCMITTARNAIDFDGINDVVQVPDNNLLDLNFPLTIETWFYQSNIGWENILVDKRTSDDNNLGYGIWITGDLHPGFYLDSNGDDYYGHVLHISGTTVSTNTWHHMAAVYDGTRVKLYIDGGLVYDQAETLPLSVNNGPLSIGDRNGGNQPFTGKMDELRIWNVARTQSQIQANMNVELHTQSGLVALYHFNEGIANADNTGINTAIDASGHNLNGELKNMALSGSTSNWVSGQTLNVSDVSISNDAPATYPKGNTTVTWTATDAAGNTNTCQQTVTVNDNEKPTIQAPSSITINCNDAIPAAATLTATDNCGANVVLSTTSTKSSDSTVCAYYNYTITRTWTATDASGNTASTSQVITVQDNTAPVIAPLSNITVTEGTIPTTVASLDNCTTTPVITYTETKVNNTPPPCKNYSYVLTRTWIATDVCGNSGTSTQLIKAEGIRLTCPSDKTINTNSDGVNNYNCSSLATAAMGVAPTFTDGCDAAVLRYTITGATTGTGNGSVAGVTFAKGISKITYSLASNVSDQCSLNLTVKDSEGPKITLTPTVVIDACTMPDPIPDTYKPIVSDNCTGTNTLEVMSDVLADQTGCATKVAAQKYIKLLTRTWKATDENGNTATAVQRIYLRDNVPPITVCKNVTVSIGSANITQPVSTLNDGSNDLCTATNLLTFTGCLNTGTTACTNFGANLTLKASMIPAGQTQTIIPVLVKAKDACGNQTVTPVSTIITLKRIGTLDNNTNNSDNSIATSDSETSIPSEASTVPTVQGEMKCYPTPFMEDLNIQYNLTETIETVTLKLYDNQGRLVKTMEQLEQEAGFYQVRWNLSDLQAGMYHVCLELNGKCTKMERVIMLK